VTVHEDADYIIKQTLSLLSTWKKNINTPYKQKEAYLNYNYLSTHDSTTYIAVTGVYGTCSEYIKLHCYHRAYTCMELMTV